VRELCRRHPERLLFGASVHPYRHSAIDMLEEVAQAGAVLVKWLPLTMNIDAENPRTIAFLRKAGEIGMPMLIHYGGERSLGNMRPEFEDPSGLLRTLRRLRQEGKMPTVIVAHVATPWTWPFGSGRYFRLMLGAMQGEFADAPLYADMAALALFSRARWLKMLARMPELHSKLVYGSDFPIPPTVGSFRRELGRLYRQVAAIPNWIDRDVAIKAGLGFGEEIFARGGELLKTRIEAWAAQQ
jgi:predicted TIM-barrel fold metal-dependent hydrolase